MGSESNNGFRSRMEYYLYSGDKKHVFVGIAIIGVVFAVPWVLMNRDAFMPLYFGAYWYCIITQSKNPKSRRSNLEVRQAWGAKAIMYSVPKWSITSRAVKKKHVFVGIVGAWVLMNRGSKHQSHQDYMDKAEKARRERLSAGSSSVKR